MDLLVRHALGISPIEKRSGPPVYVRYLPIAYGQLVVHPVRFCDYLMNVSPDRSCIRAFGFLYPNEINLTLSSVNSYRLANNDVIRIGKNGLKAGKLQLIAMDYAGLC